MIEQTPIARDETSRYFHHNVGLAKTWEDLCEQVNGTIEGQVNGQILEFTLKFNIQNMNIRIEGLRQISNINAGFKTGFSMKKSTIINISPSAYKNTSWKIYKNYAFFNFINSLIFNTKQLDGYPNYSIAYKKKQVKDERDIIDDFKYLRHFAELRSIKLKNDHMQIEYFTMLGVDAVKKIIARFIAQHKAI